MMAHENADKIKRDAEAAAAEAKADLSEGARRIADNVRETVQELSDNAGLERLREHGADLAATARDAGREYADMAREKGEEYVERARAEAERLYETGQRTAAEAAHYAEERYDELSETVRRHPAQALGIAAGIGFLVGLLLARR